MRFQVIIANESQDPDKNDHPGQPWTPPQNPPSPDGTTPDGSGKHKK